ncbi:MAG: HAD-IIIA family hydrolase [Planctomycetes bacterium]|nr:HAD-IIIA family hydrolase [Planctomycetota bacterium]
MSFAPNLLAKAAKVKLLLSDVDGCWTDGTITYDHAGKESVTFYAHDGYGIKQVQKSGLEVVIISGRHNPAVAARAKQLGIQEIHLGISDKTELAKSLVAARGLNQNQVAALGDDLPDLPLFDAAILRCAPPQATATILQLADYITQADAGRGALREVCELLLAATSPKSGSRAGTP